MSKNENTEPKFYELGEDTVKFVKDIISEMALPMMFNIEIVGTSKLKGLVKLQKANDLMSYFASGVNLLILINEDYFITLDEEISKILIYQELDRISYNLEKGTFKLEKFKLQTNPGVLKKFGIDAVANANQIADVYAEQKADADQDEIDQNVANVAFKNKSFEFLS